MTGTILISNSSVIPRMRVMHRERGVWPDAIPPGQHLNCAGMKDPHEYHDTTAQWCQAIDDYISNRNPDVKHLFSVLTACSKGKKWKSYYPNDPEAT